jgi:uncharacterized protein YqeY
MFRIITRRTSSFSFALLALSARTSTAFHLRPLPSRACLSFHTSTSLLRAAAGGSAGSPGPTDDLSSSSSSSAAPAGAPASIVDQVTDEMKKAMRAKDTVRLNTIRLIRAAFGNAAIEAKTEQLSDEQAITVLRKMAKMRQDSIVMFTDGGAVDRADMEQAELVILNAWLPQQADEETTRKWVQEAIEAAGGDAKNIGKIMGALMKAHKAEIDGSLAQKVVKEEVAKRMQ